MILRLSISLWVIASIIGAEKIYDARKIIMPTKSLIHSNADITFKNPKVINVAMVEARSILPEDLMSALAS